MLQLRKLFAVAFAVASSAGFCGAAGATVVSHVDLPEGLGVALLARDEVVITVTSSGGDFKSKTVAGVTATGISAGMVDGEIDNTEFMQFTFDRPVTITLLSIAHLFMEGNYGDQPDETAAFLTTAGNFQLVASGATTADWNGQGSVANDSPAIDDLAGAWTISGADIFGGPITSLTLRSGNPGANTALGDFGFRELQFTSAVAPAPGAGTLLVLLAIRPRRRRA